MTRTLLVGLDSADWRFLQPLLDRGDLPVLQSLVEAGVSGRLQSTMPPWTPAAWASISTGTNPGKHGVYDFLRVDAATNDRTVLHAGHRDGRPFWAYLNDAGLRVGLVNIPFTYPPEPLEGFVLVGFGTPEEAAALTYPQEALESLQQAVGPYRPVVPASLLKSGDEAAILMAERRHQSQQVEAACLLSQRHNVDILVINLMLLDHVNHKAASMDIVEEAIRAMDDHLGRLVKGFEPDNVLVISDHGARRLRGSFLLHAWLMDHGYKVARPRTPGQRQEALNWLLTRWLQDLGLRSGLVEKVARRSLVALMRRMNGPGLARLWGSLERSYPFSKDYLRWSEGVDPRRTPLVPGSTYSGLLYFNLQGKGPEGWMSPWEAEDLGARLARDLAEVRDPETGEPIVSQVYTKDSLYHGPHAAGGPDLILDPYGGPWNVQGDYYPLRARRLHGKYLLANSTEFGGHRREGIFVFAGDPFRHGEVGTESTVMDVPATLLYLHGVPIPDDFDGRPLLETFTETFVSIHPVEHQAPVSHERAVSDIAYSQEEARELTEHLRALGYLD